MTLANKNRRHLLYRSPLSSDIVGAAVTYDDEVLGVAWDLDPDRAKLRATGEALERIALRSTIFDFTRTPDGPMMLPLDRATRFSAEQVATHPALVQFSWNPVTPTSWIVGERLGSPSEPVSVPADLVLMRGVLSDPVRLRPVNSAGTAAHSSLDQSVQRAVAECVERHVVCVAHRQGTPAALVKNPTDATVATLARVLSRAGCDLQIGLFPAAFGVAVATAAIVSDANGRPTIAVGSGANRTPAAATRAAALEALQVFHFAWQLLCRGVTTPKIPTNAQQRAVWWATRKPFLVRDLFGPESVPQPSLDDDDAWLPHVVEKLSDAGHQGALLTLDAGPGGHVARVILPSLLLPHADDRYPYLATPSAPGLAVPETPHPYV